MWGSDWPVLTMADNYSNWFDLAMNYCNSFSEDEKNKMVRENISIIFQNNNLLSDFTALENVALPLIIRETNYKTSIKKAEKFLKKVNLGHRLNHFPSDLSGGEQQRVAIARSIASDTSIILADEPTGNLDEKTSQEVFSYFLKLKEKNKTIPLPNRLNYNKKIRSCTSIRFCN